MERQLAALVGGEIRRRADRKPDRHVYALLKLPKPAAHYLGKALPYFLQNDCAPSELAFAHAVAANVAWAEGDAEAHARHYSQAQAAGAQIANPEERRILEATLRVIPAPSP